MHIYPATEIRQNYNKVAELCRSSMAPVYLTKNGEGDLVVMDIEAFSRREKMLQLREDLLVVEEERAAGITGCTIDDLDTFLDGLLEGE